MAFLNTIMTTEKVTVAALNFSLTFVKIIFATLKVNLTASNLMTV